MSSSSSNNYSNNWEKTKEYLIRSLFTDNPALSPVPEESVASSKSVRDKSVESSHSSSRADSPVPPLIIEAEPDKHDDPPVFYQQLHIKMLRLYRKLFVERCERVSSINSDDSQNDFFINEEITAQQLNGADAECETYYDDNQSLTSNINNEEIETTAEQLIEANAAESGNYYDNNQSLTENINNGVTTAHQVVEDDNTFTERSNDCDHISETEDIDVEEQSTHKIFEEGDQKSESSHDYADELRAIINRNNDDSLYEHSISSPILQTFGHGASSNLILENKTDPDESASSNTSIMQREIEVMRGVTQRHYSFGLLQPISTSSLDDIEDPMCISTKNMDETISSTHESFSRKRQSQSGVHQETSTPMKIVKYRDKETQTAFGDIWESYFKLNFFAGTPKLFKLCSCRHLCNC